MHQHRWGEGLPRGDRGRAQGPPRGLRHGGRRGARRALRSAGRGLGAAAAGCRCPGRGRPHRALSRARGRLQGAQARSVRPGDPALAQRQGRLSLGRADRARSTTCDDYGGMTMGGEGAAVRSIPASQLARRERILDAAMELAAEGGYDAVQMREVAERADVALGTVYRYFPSKVHLLVAAMTRTFQTLQESVHVDTSGTPEERLYRVVAAVTRYLARNRRLSGAMVRALMSADPEASREVEQADDMLVSLIVSATRDPNSTSAPEERDTLVAHIIGKVWLTDVVTLLSGRMTVSQVLEDLQATIALVTRP